MLNEKKEYELYLTGGYGKLLTKDNIENGLSGLRHILTVLARGFLELLDAEGGYSLAEKDALCQEFLFCWINEKYTLPEKVSDKVAAEFKKAKSCSLLKHIVKNEIKVKGFGGCEQTAVEKALEGKISAWKKSMFFSLSENSVNEIKVRAIIADALLAGPLTNKKLVIKSDRLFYGIDCNEKHVEYIDSLLAIVGACLKRLKDGQNGAVVKMCELSNYLAKPTNNKNKRSSPLYSVDGYFSTPYLTYGGAPILRKEAVTGGVVKVFLNENWVNDLGVRLADQNEKVPVPFIALDDFDLLRGRF